MPEKKWMNFGTPDETMYPNLRMNTAGSVYLAKGGVCCAGRATVRAGLKWLAYEKTCGLPARLFPFEGFLRILRCETRLHGRFSWRMCLDPVVVVFAHLFDTGWDVALPDRDPAIQRH